MMTTLLSPLVLGACVAAGNSLPLKQFNFHCYNVDYCTFPLHYCSSEPYLKRCMPCSESVCQMEAPPLACDYNCTMRQTQHQIMTTAQPITSVDAQPAKNVKDFVVFIAVIGILLAYSAIITAFVTCFQKNGEKKHWVTRLLRRKNVQEEIPLNPQPGVDDQKRPGTPRPVVAEEQGGFSEVVPTVSHGLQ